MTTISFKPRTDGLHQESLEHAAKMLASLAVERGTFRFFMRKSSPHELTFLDRAGLVRTESIGRTMMFGLVQGLEDQPSEQIWDCQVTLDPSSSELARIRGFEIGAQQVSTAGRVFIRRTVEEDGRLLILGVLAGDITVANGEEIWEGRMVFEPIRKYEVGGTFGGLRADQVYCHPVFAFPERYLPLAAGEQIKSASDYRATS